MGILIYIRDRHELIHRINLSTTKCYVHLFFFLETRVIYLCSSECFLNDFTRLLRVEHFARELYGTLFSNNSPTSNSSIQIVATSHRRTCRWNREMKQANIFVVFRFFFSQNFYLFVCFVLFCHHLSFSLLRSWYKVSASINLQTQTIRTLCK